ncbi:MAG: M55 family metallopeptidase [Chloroflexota bacterium]|nr:M55 family metallopeptidase [Chloroflexota bacterium]
MGTKIYIMTDMEGISGGREPFQCDPEHPEWQRARRLLVGDVNAAIAGAFDGGADEVLVSDGHSRGFNFPLWTNGQADRRPCHGRHAGRLPGSYPVLGEMVRVQDQRPALRGDRPGGCRRGVLRSAGAARRRRPGGVRGGEGLLLTYTRQDYADQVALNPGVERLGARTVRKVVQRGIDALGF